MKPLPFVLFLVAAALPGWSSASPAAPTQCGEDAFEDNDSCATSSAVLAPFAATGLAVYRTDPDYFALTVAPGEELVVDALFSHSVADVEVWIYDRNGACGGIFTFLANGTTSTDNESVTWTNLGATPAEVAVKVEIFPGDLSRCNNYDLSIATSPSTSTCDPALDDDGLEENDSCASAVPLPVGVTPNLWVSRLDGDFYRTTLQPGENLDARVLFSHSASDIDIFLYRASGPCGGGISSGELAAGFTQSNNERIIWSNTNGSPVDVILHVDVFQTGSCNTYTMDIRYGSGGIGSNFCQAVANSTGNLGLMRAEGSTSIASNNIVLIATQLPTNQFGMLLNSLTSGFVPNPGGSTGNLCLSGAIGRHISQIASSDSNGVVTFPLNNQAIPTPSGPTAATAGQDWKFQAWYRDTAGTSNFTNGISIVMVP